jgi:hypothetical protein
MAIDIEEAQRVIAAIRVKHPIEVIESVSVMNFFNCLSANANLDPILAQRMVAALVMHEFELLKAKGFSIEQINACLDSMQQAGTTLSMLASVPD